jgi:glucokinase
MTQLALGIDIGGTNTAFGLVDLNGTIIFEESQPTKNYPTPEDLITFLYKHSEIKKNLNSIIGIGIGAPNGNHFTGTIEYAPNLDWKGIIPLKELFENQFNKPTQLTNDANAAAVGEKIFGAAKTFKNFVTITLGTGLGSGIYIDNQLVYGAHGIAGEYGHIRVIPQGRQCKCGRLGCLETYVSATGVVRSIKELKSTHSHTSEIHTIIEPSAKDVFQLAEKGDIFCKEIIDYTAEILGSSLADFAAFSDPEAYILFGGIAQSGSLFTNKVKEAMEKNILNIYKDKITIATSTLHDQNAAILGNAATIFSNTNTL